MCGWEPYYVSTCLSLSLESSYRLYLVIYRPITASNSYWSHSILTFGILTVS